jgi:hypothetical protein
MSDFDKPISETVQERIRRIREAIERRRNSNISTVSFRMNAGLTSNANSSMSSELESVMFII